VTQRVSVAPLNELAPGQRRFVRQGKVSILVVNAGGMIYAVDDLCTHDNGPLGEGEIVNDDQVKCPRHGARFSLKTGQALSLPAVKGIRSYPVVVENDHVYVELQPAAPAPTGRK